MAFFYKIYALCPGLDGLIAQSSKGPVLISNVRWVEVDRIINPNAILGDRQVIIPLSSEGLRINERFLQDCEDPTGREFASDNPFGKFIDECRYEQGTLRVTLGHYEKALSVDIKDTGVKPVKTIFSANYSNSKSTQTIKNHISDFFESPGKDVDDLIFLLQDESDPTRKDQ